MEKVDIKFSILDEDMKALEKISLEEFEEWCGIEGQFEISMGAVKFGFVHEEIPFASELLISWFEKLSKVVRFLVEGSEYVVTWAPDSYKWLEFIVEGDKLKVTEIESVAERIGFLITNERHPELFKYTDVVGFVGKEDFIECVFKSTKEFILVVSKINKKLLESSGIKRILENLEIEKIWRKSL